MSLLQGDLGGSSSPPLKASRATSHTLPHHYSLDPSVEAGYGLDQGQAGGFHVISYSPDSLTAGTGVAPSSYLAPFPTEYDAKKGFPPKSSNAAGAASVGAGTGHAKASDKEVYLRGIHNLGLGDSFGDLDDLDLGLESEVQYSADMYSSGAYTGVGGGRGGGGAGVGDYGGSSSRTRFGRGGLGTDLGHDEGGDMASTRRWRSGETAAVGSRGKQAIVSPAATIGLDLESSDYYSTGKGGTAASTLTSTGGSAGGNPRRHYEWQSENFGMEASAASSGVARITR